MAKAGRRARCRARRLRGAARREPPRDFTKRLAESSTIEPEDESSDTCSFPDADVRTLAQLAMVAMNRGKCWKAMELLARRPWGLQALRLMIDARPGIVSAREVRTRWTLLHYAASHRRGFVVALLEAGADPNARGTPYRNWTPLFYATKNRKHGASVVSCLLEHGADPHAKNAEGETALHFAARHNNGDICKLLIAAGSDVNSRDNSDRKALELAARHTAPECIETLLAAGAKVTRNVAAAAMWWGSPRGLQMLFRAEPCCVHWVFDWMHRGVRWINVEYLNRIRKAAVEAQFVPEFIGRGGSGQRPRQIRACTEMLCAFQNHLRTLCGRLLRTEDSSVCEKLFRTEESSV